MNFGRVISAMVTPMHDDYRVNFDYAQELGQYLLAHGTDTLVISGTTGESPTLSKEEKLKLFAAMREAAPGKIIAGTCSNDTAASVELSKKAEALGVDAILAVVPYYNKPPQEGLYQHFKAVAEAVSLPVMLYNVPGRSKVSLAPQTVARLAEIENIVAIKEADPDVERCALMARLLPEDFQLYCGDDSLTLPLLTLGAHGIVSVAGHLVGEKIQAMIAALLDEGDLAKARELHFQLMPVFKEMFITASPIPLKYCLNRIGLKVGPCRLPLVEATAAEKAVLDETLKLYGFSF